MLEEMIEEVRQEFQIPPYFPDEFIRQLTGIVHNQARDVHIDAEQMRTINCNAVVE